MRTAYFDIPANAQHGMLLVCSHPACAESGRCFRYCAVCDVPVTKRNFPMRHAHGLTKEDGELSSAIAVVDLNTLAGSKRQRSVSFASDVAPSSEASMHTAMAAAPAATFQLMNTTAAAASNNSAARSSEGKMKMQLNPTEFKWLALLHNRPSMDDMDALNQWMDNVLKLSEQKSSPPSTSSSLDAQAASITYSSAQDDSFFHVGDCTENDANDIYSL